METQGKDSVSRDGSENDTRLRHVSRDRAVFERPAHAVRVDVPGDVDVDAVPAADAPLKVLVCGGYAKKQFC